MSAKTLGILIVTVGTVIAHSPFTEYKNTQNEDLMQYGKIQQKMIWEE